MDFGAVAKSISDQFVTVWNAPVPFLTVCVALWFLLRWFIRGQFETRLANAESTIAMLERKLDRQEVGEVMALASQADKPASTPNSSPSRAKIAETGSTDIGPDQLIEMTKDRTELQKKPIVAKYLGKRMVAAGKVMNVAGYMYISGAVLVLDVGDTVAACSFSEVTDRLMALKSGDELSISGVFAGMSSTGIEMEDCRIL